MTPAPDPLAAARRKLMAGRPLDALEREAVEALDDYPGELPDRADLVPLGELLRRRNLAYLALGAAAAAAGIVVASEHAESLIATVAAVPAFLLATGGWHWEFGMGGMDRAIGVGTEARVAPGTSRRHRLALFATDWFVCLSGAALAPWLLPPEPGPRALVLIGSLAAGDAAGRCLGAWRVARWERRHGRRLLVGRFSWREGRRNRLFYEPGEAG